MSSVFPCLLVCEAKSREKVKGLINVQFIFIVSRCFNLLVLGAISASLLRLPKYIVSTDSDRNTKDKNQFCSSPEWHSSLTHSNSGRTAWGGGGGRRSQGGAGWTTGWRESRGQQQAGTGGGLEGSNGEILKWSPHSPKPAWGPQHGVARWALTLCVLYQGPERGPPPAPDPPKDAFQDARSKMGRMPMSLTMVLDIRLTMCCHTSGNGWLWGEVSRTGTWHSLPGVGKAAGAGHSTRRCVWLRAAAAGGPWETLSAKYL